MCSLQGLQTHEEAKVVCVSVKFCNVAAGSLTRLVARGLNHFWISNWKKWGGGVFFLFFGGGGVAVSGVGRCSQALGRRGRLPAGSIVAC